MQRASAAVSWVMTALLGTLAHPSYAGGSLRRIQMECSARARAVCRCSRTPRGWPRPRLCPTAPAGPSLRSVFITAGADHPVGSPGKEGSVRRRLRRFGPTARAEAGNLSDRARSARMDRRRGQARCYTVERLCRGQCLQRAAQAGAIRAARRGTVAAAERRRHRGYQANTDPGPRPLAYLGASPRGSMPVSSGCAAKL